MPDGYRALEPPDTISNSEVKRCIADGSVGSPHVRVGHYQALFFIQILLAKDFTDVDFPEAKLKALVVYLTNFVILFYWFIIFALLHRNFNNSLILE